MTAAAPARLLGSQTSRAKDKTLLSRVPFAWPTVTLLVAAVGLWSASVTFALMGFLPLPLAALICSIAAFAAFTPMHDASHHAMGSSSLLNETAGRVCSLLLTAPFPAFRYLHLQHHKHTNDPVKDPDMWSGTGPTWSLPLRWLTQDQHYYYAYLKALRTRPRAESIETIATLVVFPILLALAIWAGYGVEILVLWVIPARLAIAMLAFSFDYLPHHPHEVTSAEDRYQATVIRPSPWLTPLFFYQNYHLVHHLYPAVPFYRYGRVWRVREADLRARGVRVL